ncbi:hypothetical protein evm_000580 [Chilo suppressalis]|nr:hypothetical protein evm_000580 [Chilo suppressalis]
MYGPLLGLILSGLLSQSYGKYWQTPPIPVRSGSVSICANNGVTYNTELQSAQMSEPSVQPLQPGPCDPVPKPVGVRYWWGNTQPEPGYRWGNTQPQPGYWGGNTQPQPAYWLGNMQPQPVPKPAEIRYWWGDTAHDGVQDDSKSMDWNPPTQIKLEAAKPTTVRPESVYGKKAKLLESSSNERDSKVYNAIRTFRTPDYVVQGYNPQYPQYMEDSLDPEECRNQPGRCLNVD